MPHSCTPLSFIAHAKWCTAQSRSVHKWVFHYRPQRSWGKVMFLQASVILLTGGVWSRGWGVSGPRGVSAPRGVCSGGCLLPGEGYLLPGGGVSAPGVSALGGVCSRVVSALGVPGGDTPPGTATAAGGTHPTGMHSCLCMPLCIPENGDVSEWYTMSCSAHPK